MLVRNIGEPIKLTGVNMRAVLAKPVAGEGKAEVWHRLSLTSDDPLFHRVIEHLDATITSYAREAGSFVNLKRADTVLLVIRPDDSAELWVDTAAISMQAIIKRDAPSGTVLFESDIADVLGMTFPLVEIRPADRIVCFFRQDWRFALHFDFNPKGNFSLDKIAKSLGTLHRNLKYRHLYDVIENETVFTRLIQAGWFPFVEIIPSEFRQLAALCEDGLDFRAFEADIVAKFNLQRLDRMFQRWNAKPHLAPREKLLAAAVAAFIRNDPIAVIKIILTEIEGILADAYRAAYGRGAKIKKLLEFAAASAEDKSGGSNTLLLSEAFARYLARYTFANFDPRGPAGTAGSRHAVGHGAAAAETYTQVRALQALLTLDQIAFYV
jgi:hypothetical protein